jgi:hypothetical protein
MNRTVARRLERLETRAKEVAAAHPKPHTLRFISVDKKVVSTFEMATCKWTHFDPPRDRAEFEPMVLRQTTGIPSDIQH